ncbi:MAG: FAD-binding oxidoreductase [Candidatus Bathyarchaeota archaeon]|nr:MAG: FAD-binding oxidoreductase [Candidatus Bathyarchaeota archaeon]
MFRDILVIGAGVLGLSSALHLKRTNPDKDVFVVDRLGGPGQGSTAKCAGIYLNHSTTELNHILMDSTVDWLHHLHDDLGHDLKLAQHGYLYLLDEEEDRKLRGPVSKMQDMGIDVRTYDREELEHMIPDLITAPDDEDSQLMGLKPIVSGVFSGKCGGVDADALSRSLEAEFLKLGGEVSYNTTADRLIVKPEMELGIPGEPFVWQDIHITGAETSRGTVEAGTTIVAAGVWSERLLDPIGFDTLMRPKSRAIFVFKDPMLDGLRDAEGFSSLNVLPFTHIAGVKTYLKVEQTEGSIWLGCADDFGRRYGLEDDPQPERGLYSNNIYHALVKHLPCFENLRPVNMWAGQRSVHRVDKTPVVAPAPGMIYVGSTTGNGVTKSDALGRTVAALYAGEDEVEAYGGRRFRASDLGIEHRRVEIEEFKV